jgi:hypothetical protein
MGKEKATADGPGRGWWSETVARTGRCPLISLDSCVAANQASHRIRAVPQCIGSQNETKSGISDDFGLQLVEVIRLQNFFGDASAYRKIGPRLLQRFRIGRARVVGDAFQRFQFLRLNRLRDQFADQLSMSSVMTFSSLHVGARMWIRLLSDHAEQLQTRPLMRLGRVGGPRVGGGPKQRSRAAIAFLGARDAAQLSLISVYGLNRARSPG